VIEYARDISEQKQAQEMLELEHKEMLSVFEGIEHPVYVTDPCTYEVLYINNAIKKDFGDVVGQRCYRVFQNLDSPCAFCTNEHIFNENIGKSHIWEVQNQRNRRWYRCFDKAINWPDGRKARCEIAIDITERKESEEELKRLNKELIKSNRRLKLLSMRDSQTGLYNQRYLQEAIEAEFHRARRYGYQFSVIMLDIDYFKSINDVYGYGFGNLVLKQFARQLKRMVRQYDVVIRFSGEEFVIISPGTDRATAVVLGQRILDAISLLNFGDKKNNIKLKLSAAVASYPDDKIVKGMSLIELADQNLNKAKEYGGNRVVSSLDIKTAEGHILDITNNAENPEVRVLKGKIAKLTKRANQGLIEAIFAFAKTIEVKDHYTGEHVERTVYYATEIARALGLSKEEVELVKQASMLHDLGKIGISEKILLKRSKLNSEEFETIKRHPQIGADILRPIHFFHNLIPLILYHHERWDGKGYPYNLKGDEVCVGARVVAIADVYQALISDRPYRKAFPRMKAIEIIQKGSGSQFDPDIVSVFSKVLQREQ
jgi:diguanylate cyclase (GGDEF)-like protein